MNHIDRQIFHQTVIPKNVNSKLVMPEILFEKEGLEVVPIQKSDNPELKEASKTLLLKAATAYS